MGLTKKTGAVVAAKSPPLLPQKKGSAGPAKVPRAKAKAVPAAAAAAPQNFGVLEQRFERLRQLGRGSYGVVWLVRCKADQRLLAMKTVPLPLLACRDEKAILERRQALREVELLQQIRSPYVVLYADMVLSPPSAENPQSELHLLTEYCEAGDLGNYIKLKGRGRGFSEDEVWGLAVPVLTGLHELHSRRILHRDLKPANIFLKRTCVPGRVVTGSGPASKLTALLGDFGLARAMSDSQPLASTLVGTPHYVAPEIFEGVPYDEKADIYSFGVCMYELMHGRTPYADVKTVVGLVRRVLRLDLGGSCNLATTAPLDARFSHELRGVVSACLERKPEMRPDTVKLLQSVPEQYRLSSRAPVCSLSSEAVAVPATSQICAEASAKDSAFGGMSPSFGFRPPSRSNSQADADAEVLMENEAVAAETPAVERTQLLEDLDKTQRPAGAGENPSASAEAAEVTLEVRFQEEVPVPGELSEVLRASLLLREPNPEEPAKQAMSLEAAEEKKEDGGPAIMDDKETTRGFVAATPAVPSSRPSSPAFRLSVAPPPATACRTNITVTPRSEGLETESDGHCARFLREQRSQQPEWGQAVKRERFLVIVLGLISLRYVAASFTETVKASSPFFTVIAAFLLTGERTEPRIFMSLLLVAGGLGAASAAELSFTLVGFLAALSTNVVECVQNVFCKRLLQPVSEKAVGYTPSQLQYYSAAASLVVQLPLFLIAYLKGHLILPGEASALCLLGLDGAVYYLQSALAFRIMSCYSPVTVSVLNTAKRALIICLSSLFFGNVITPVAQLGTAVTLAGSGLYSLMKSSPARGLTSADAFASSSPVTVRALGADQDHSRWPKKPSLHRRRFCFAGASRSPPIYAMLCAALFCSISAGRAAGFGPQQRHGRSIAMAAHTMEDCNLPPWGFGWKGPCTRWTTRA